jgi:hypothetical protein
MSDEIARSNTPPSRAPATRDYFAEMYVAGLFADARWNVYFPRRDKGFDFIAVKELDGRSLVRPVQVKGKYPTRLKTDKPTYGYVGRLSILHEDMVLAVVFFDHGGRNRHPVHVAYMPRRLIRPLPSRGYKCEPATIRGGAISPRREYRRYFDDEGISALSRIGA